MCNADDAEPGLGEQPEIVLEHVRCDVETEPPDDEDNVDQEPDDEPVVQPQDEAENPEPENNQPIVDSEIESAEEFEESPEEGQALISPEEIYGGIVASLSILKRSKIRLEQAHLICSTHARRD